MKKKLIPQVKCPSRDAAEKKKASKELSSRGFVVPGKAEFYRVLKNGRVGMKVGEYIHECHLGSTTIYILLFSDFRIGETAGYEPGMELESL